MTGSDPDARWMAQALALGSRGAGRTWPNPFVGCVIVRNGRVVGRGHTSDGGRPHAEDVALTRAAAAAEGATVYVSLEPCTGHDSRACSTRLGRAGIKRLVAAVEDPDPRMRGRGLQYLREAGIEVSCGCLEVAARRAHQGFFLRVTEQRPMVTLKTAASFDGAAALSSGESRWITCASARRRVHLMRSRHDAVLIGSGTAAKDDPALTVRDLGIDRWPVRVLFDSAAALSCNAKLVQTASSAPVWVCHTERASTAKLGQLKARGVVTIACKSDASGRLDPSDALSRLAAKGLTRIFCEGGPSLAASLLRENLVDRLVGFAAGSVLGGDALPVVAGMNLRQLADAPKFRLEKLEPVGACVLHVWSATESTPDSAKADDSASGGKSQRDRASAKAADGGSRSPAAAEGQ